MLVAARANFHCEYCQCPKNFVPVPFRSDHIVPESKGGSSDWENLAFACDACNGSKHKKVSAIDPLTGVETRLFHPRKDSWSAHFTWSNDFLLIEGITPVGRATVEALQMNRNDLVNLRGMLKAFKWHPPTTT